MYLYYYKHGKDVKNFGDDLNPWIWDKLLPGLLDDDKRIILIGIGTLINDQIDYLLPKESFKLVFSTGVGYGNGLLPHIDEKWKFYCVRGTLSARELNLPGNYALADGAILIRTVVDNTYTKKTKYSFMPHIEQAIGSGERWKKVCEEIGFVYIDPRSDTEIVLQKICETEILVTEAMHGAIVADAMRVPWIPVTSHKKILSFKWDEWCMSINKEYSPKEILPFWGSCNNFSMKVKEIAKEKINKRNLKKIVRDISPTLSDNKLLDKLTSSLSNKLDVMRNDIISNYFE